MKKIFSLFFIFLSFVWAIVDAPFANGAADYEIDTAIVKTATANLREASNKSSRVIKVLKKGDVLALLERTSINDLYNVIDIASGDEGWIHRKTIDITLSNNTRTIELFAPGGKIGTAPIFREDKMDKR